MNLRNKFLKEQNSFSRRKKGKIKGLGIYIFQNKETRFDINYEFG